MRFFRLRRAIILLLVISASAIAVTAAANEQKFQSDEWVTECDTATGAPDCSITVPFWQGERQRDGAFALVVMLQTGNIGIVGQPSPTRAVLRVDKNPPIECRPSRFCVFPSAQALAVFRQLKDASLIVVDVFTAKGTFSFNLTPKGYQAGIAKIRSWGYSLPGD
jgi:invasion protein IalB